MLNKYLSKDTRLAKLRSEYALIDKNDESSRKKNIEAQTAMIQGTAVGKMFHNQQSLAGFISILNNLDDVKRITEAVKGQFSSGSELNNSFQMHADTSNYKVSQAHEESLVAQKKAIDKLTPAIGRAADSFSAIAREYPLLTGSTTLATTAIGAMAGSAALAAVALSQISKRLPVGASPVATRSGGGAVGKVGRGLATAAASAAAVGLGGEALQSVFGDDSRMTRYGTRALNYAAIGATIGSVAPVLGTAAGAAAGGVLGLVVEAVRESFQGVQKEKPQEVNFKAQIGLSPELRVQQQSIQSSEGVKTDFKTGNIMTGAPA